MKATRTELNGWLEKEDAMWLQRSRIDWFQSGDRNTRYFHARASTHLKKNLIEGLLDSNDVWQEEDNRIEEIVVDYYLNLFTSSNHVECDEILQAIQQKVTPTMNHALSQFCTANEVWKTLK